MINSILLRRAVAAACLALAFPLSATAQSNGSSNTVSADSDSDYSWIPYTRKGYWGINVGRPSYDDALCTPGFSCEDPSLGGKIYVGGQFNDWLGVEIGYVNLGSMERNGGNTKAQGINMGLVGTLPLNNSFSMFAKVGTTYSWTDVSADVGGEGKEEGFGLSYGAGLAFNLSPRTQLLAEWGRHEIQFADQKDGEDVDLYSVGVKFRF